MTSSRTTPTNNELLVAQSLSSVCQLHKSSVLMEKFVSTSRDNRCINWMSRSSSAGGPEILVLRDDMMQVWNTKPLFKEKCAEM